MLALAVVFSLFITFVLPVLLVIFVIRLATRKKDRNGGPWFAFRDVLLTVLIVAAGYTGVAAVYALPFSIFGSEKEFANQVLTMHLVSAIALLAAGIFVQKITGKFLMVLGLLILIAGAGPAFQTLGSTGALVAVLIAFSILIAITVRVSRKAHTNG